MKIEIVMNLISCSNYNDDIEKKYVIDCVTSKFVLERNCTEKTKRSGEVVGEKEKKGGPKCTRGTSYLRRKLT